MTLSLILLPSLTSFSLSLTLPSVPFFFHTIHKLCSHTSQLTFRHFRLHYIFILVFCIKLVFLIFTRKMFVMQWFFLIFWNFPNNIQIIFFYWSLKTEALVNPHQRQGGRECSVASKAALNNKTKKKPERFWSHIILKAYLIHLDMIWIHVSRGRE